MVGQPRRGLLGAGLRDRSPRRRRVAVRRPRPEGRVPRSTACTARSRAPERVVFTEIFEPFPDAESVVTSVLTEEGGKTRLTVTVALSVARGARHGARDRHGEGRRASATTVSKMSRRRLARNTR